MGLKKLIRKQLTNNCDSEHVVDTFDKKNSDATEIFKSDLNFTRIYSFEAMM